VPGFSLADAGSKPSSLPQRKTCDARPHSRLSSRNSQLLSPLCLLLQAGLENDEQRVGAEIVRRALPYSLKLIARNAGSNGSVVVGKVGTFWTLVRVLGFRVSILPHTCHAFQPHLRRAAASIDSPPHRRPRFRRWPCCAYVPRPPASASSSAALQACSLTASLPGDDLSSPLCR